MAYSVVTYTGDGATTQFAVPYPFISRDHVSVKVNGVAKVPSWINDGLLQLSPAPALDAVVIISRDSSRTTPLVDFQDAQLLTEADLDLATKQNLYVAQEAFDASDASEIAVEVQANANAAAASALAAANSAVASSASANNSANSAAAAAVSEANAATSAAAITNVWHLNAPNTVTNAQRATIDPNDTYDISFLGEDLSATFHFTPSSPPKTVTSGKVMTGWHSDGAYTLGANASLIPWDAYSVVAAGSDPTSSVYSLRSRLALSAQCTGYGVYSRINTALGGTYAYPMYLKVLVDNAPGAGAVLGDLLTLEVESSAGEIFNGNGIVIKGTGSAPLIQYGVTIQENVNVGTAAFKYKAFPSSGADLVQFAADGDLSQDSRFAVDANGNIVFGDFLGQRILGTFNGPVHAARVMFGDYFERAGFGFGDADVFVGARPGGTHTKSGFNVYGATDPDNTHYGSLNANVVANTIGVDSDKTGTGTVRPFVFSFAGTEKTRITELGDIGINCPATDLWTGTISSLQIKGRSSGSLIRMTDSTEATSVHMFTDVNGFGFNAAGASPRMLFNVNGTGGFNVAASGRTTFGAPYTDDGVNTLQVIGGLGVTGTIETAGITATGPTSGFQIARRDTSALAFQLYSQAGSLQFFSNIAGADRASLTSAGAFNVTASYSVAGTQVVGPRVTGWNAPSGTLTRGTFNSAATLATTAQTLAALIADLRTHGVIGT